MDNNLIFTDMEMHILAQTMGASDWNLIPAAANGEPVAKLMLDALFSLQHKGFFEMTDRGYRCDERIQKLLKPVFYAEQTGIYKADDGMVISITVQGDECRILEMVKEELHSCRVGAIDADGQTDYIKERLNLTDDQFRDRTEISPGEKTGDYAVILYILGSDRNLRQCFGIGKKI